MALLPNTIYFLLLLVLSEKCFVTTSNGQAFSLGKCLNTSRRLSTSLTEALTSLGVCLGKIEGVDCLDLKNKGVTKSGVYTIHPSGRKMVVYCDMTTDGGGWTVFQRRVNGLVDFYKGWKSYRYGFGNPEGSFWLGLENIHTLTSFKRTTKSSLRVDMWIPGEHRYEKYSNFKVGDAKSDYTLAVSGASGSANDSMTYHNGMKFTTKDRDNDLYGGNCAVTFKGAWWYKSCHFSNLNGLYLNGEYKEYATGINWEKWTGYYYSLLKVEMKMRRYKQK